MPRPHPVNQKLGKWLQQVGLDVNWDMHPLTQLTQVLFKPDSHGLCSPKMNVNLQSFWSNLAIHPPFVATETPSETSLADVS